MFGDVVSVHTETGAYAGGYEYDAWGNITSGGGSGIGAVNPFRYRGYYYDQETGFYYLQSRYYDPEICRFISADNLELIPSLSQVPGQLNLYAYCNNNPIMFTDPSGEIAITTAILIGLGVGAAVGLGVGLTYGLVTGARGWELAGYIILGASGGALLGGLIGAVIWSGAAAIQMLNSGFLYLAGGGGGTAGGALAVADVSVMVAGSVIVVGGTMAGLQLGTNIMFSGNAQRYGKSKLGSNGRFNKQFDDFWKQYGNGNLDTRRSFHDYITKKGYDKWDQLLKAWKDFMVKRGGRP